MKVYQIICIISMMICYSTASRMWGTRITTVGCTNVQPNIICPPGVQDCDSYCDYVALYHDRFAKNITTCACSYPPKECPVRSPTYCTEFCHLHIWEWYNPNKCIKAEVCTPCPKGVDCKIWCDYYEMYKDRYKRGEHLCAKTGEAVMCPYSDWAYCLHFCHPERFIKVLYD